MHEVATDAHDVHGVHTPGDNGNDHEHHRVETTPASRDDQRHERDRGEEHRDPEPVGAHEVAEVREPLRPARGRCFLGQRGVRHDRGVVPHAEDLVERRHDRHENDHHRPAPPSGPALGDAQDHDEREREDGHVRPHERSQADEQRRAESQQGRAAGWVLARTVAGREHAPGQHQPARTEPGHREPVLEAGGREVPERWQHRDHRGAQREQQAARPPERTRRAGARRARPSPDRQPSRGCRARPRRARAATAPADRRASAVRPTTCWCPLRPARPR